MAVAPSTYTGAGAPNVARLPMPAAGSSGEAIAEGAGALGQSLHRADMQRSEDALRTNAAIDRAKEIEDERALAMLAAKHSADLATRQAGLQTRIAELRAGAHSGAEGHQAAVASEIENFRSGFMHSLGDDPRLQARFIDNVASIAANTNVRETEWSIEQRAAAYVTNGGQLANQLGSNVQTAVLSGEANGQTLSTAGRQWDEYVAGTHLPEDARTQLSRDGHRAIQSGAMRGLIERDPGGASAAIDQGWGEDLFTPQERAAFRNQAVSQSEHVAAQARAAEERAGNETRARGDVLIGQVNDGVVLDHDSRAFLEAEAARTAGSRDPADIRQHDQVMEALDRNVVNNQFDTATQGQRRAALAQIEQQPNWRSDPQMVRRHSALETLIGRDAQEASTNQLGQYVSRRGRALPALDFANAAAMNVRFQLGDAAARENGQPPQYLVKDEADHLREQWNGGTPAERSAMLAQMAQFGYSRAGLLLRQILPAAQENRDSAALLRLATQRDSRAGFAAVSEALNGWAAPANSNAEKDDQMQTDLTRAYGTALAGMPGDHAAGVLNVARGIYRHRAAQRNLGRYDRGLWLESYQAALGRSGDTGGIATWGVSATVPIIGNIRAGSGAPYVLPRGMAAHDVEYVVSRATPEMWRQASDGDTPVWRAGVPLAEGNIAALTPVLVYDDNNHARYQFRNQSGFLQSTAHPGQPYVVDIQALAARVYLHRRQPAARRR